VTSFDDFVVARGQSLTKLAHLLSHDRGEAEDLVQETLASAYARWHKIERADYPEAYVRRMMVNRHISLWRRHRGRVEPRHVLPERTVPDPSATSDLSHALRDIVRTLPAKQRAAVVLRYYADYADADIAEALGCSPATVRSQISRALTTLRGAAERSGIDVADADLIALPARERIAP
jgi:RNA polymerase sigma-70 factor (sigma-E family)